MSSSVIPSAKYSSFISCVVRSRNGSTATDRSAIAGTAVSRRALTIPITTTQRRTAAIATAATAPTDRLSGDGFASGATEDASGADSVASTSVTTSHGVTDVAGASSQGITLAIIR